MKVSTVFIATISVASLILSVSALAKKPTAVAEKEQQIQQIQGLNGSNGKDGLNGLNGLDGRDGRDGRDGKDGKDGIDGKDGTNGYTPYIGDNGNWFINGEDTGYFAGIKLPEEFEEKEESIKLGEQLLKEALKKQELNEEEYTSKDKLEKVFKLLNDPEALKEMEKEELIDFESDYVLIGSCSNGDNLILFDNGNVSRISHEGGPTEIEQWNNLHNFIADTISQ